MTDSWSLQVSDLVHYMSSTAHSDPHFSNLVADYILWVILLFPLVNTCFNVKRCKMYTLTHKQMLRFVKMGSNGVYQL